MNLYLFKEGRLISARTVPLPARHGRNWQTIEEAWNSESGRLSRVQQVKLGQADWLTFRSLFMEGSCHQLISGFHLPFGWLLTIMVSAKPAPSQEMGKLFYCYFSFFLFTALLTKFQLIHSLTHSTPNIFKTGFQCLSLTSSVYHALISFFLCFDNGL
jgi:hypothetical protein